MLLGFDNSESAMFVIDDTNTWVPQKKLAVTTLKSNTKLDNKQTFLLQGYFQIWRQVILKFEKFPNINFYITKTLALCSDVPYVIVER